MTNKKMRGMVVSATSLLIFCACFMVSIGLAAAAPSLSIDPALTDGLAAGDTFSVTVNVNSDGISLDGLEFKLAYDTTTLSVTDATYDGLMGAEGSDVLTFKNFADDGEISFAAADNTPASQIGTVITVDFAVKAGAADGMYDLNLMDGILVNGINAIPDLAINDGEAQVGDDIVIPPEEDSFVQIIADSGTFGEGESFQATVVLDSQDYTVSGVELSLMYDNSAISVTGATYESLMGPEGSDVIIIKDLADDGKISFSAVDKTPAMQNGDLLTIDFEVKTGAPDGFYDLDLMDVTVVNGVAVIPGVDAIDDTVHINTVPAVQGIMLMPGWNLISIPETLNDPSMANVLQDFDSTVIDSVFYDDASTGTMVVPTDFEPLKAYWVHNALTEYVVINKDYLTPSVPTTPPSLTLYPGWNAVGHTASVELSAEIGLTTIDDCYSKVMGPWMAPTNEYTFIGYNGVEGIINDNHVGTDVFSMDIYEGFYVFVDEVCVLA